MADNFTGQDDDTNSNSWYSGLSPLECTLFVLFFLVLAPFLMQVRSSTKLETVQSQVGEMNQPEINPSKAKAHRDAEIFKARRKIN